MFSPFRDLQTTIAWIRISRDVALSKEDELGMRRLAQVIAQELTGYAFAGTPVLEN